MILESHVGERPVGQMALHKDDIRSHNHLDNLMWGTSKLNAEHRTTNRRARGRDAAAAKLTREQVLMICDRLDAGDKTEAIAVDFGITAQAVTKINTGHAWQWLTHRGPKDGRISTHRNHARKLDATKAREIVRLVGNGMSQRQIGEIFGVRKQTVEAIMKGKAWSHATGIERRM